MHIGHIRLGDIPRVAVSISDQESLSILKDIKADVWELRADLMKQVTIEVIHARVRDLQSTGIPVLLAVRNDAQEGAQKALSDEDKWMIFEALMTQVDAIDIEWRSPLCARVVALARAHDKTVVVSWHNFQQMPDREGLEDVWNQAKAAGGDIIKIAAQAQNKEEVRRLMAFTADHQNEGLITMALGAQGRISRLVYFTVGSLMTYSFIHQSTAPGQIPFDQLQQDLIRYFPAYTQCISE